MRKHPGWAFQHAKRRPLFIRNLLIILLAGLFAVSKNVGAENKIPKPLTNKEIYVYQGADRDQQLVEKAKKEGRVVIYSTLTVKDSQVLAAAYERKYGIKTIFWRGGSEKIMQRAITEAGAGHHEADVFEMNAPQMGLLYRERILEEFYSPAFKDIPPEAIPKHKHYVADRFVFFVMAYNTRLVKPDEVPNTYADLLQPKWTGRFGIEASDVVWLAAVVKAMGEEQGLKFFRKLAGMKPDMRANHILIAELVAAGEIPLVLTAYNNNVETLKKKGAPIEWKPLPPAFGQASAIGLAKQAPHPHAALLFADFLLSKEGQEILKQLNRVPSSLAVDSPLNKFPYRLIDPAIVLDEWDKWEKLWSEIFLKGQPVKKEGINQG
ncbi:MAG TPA: extracellular solute-binding protein [Acidiferrobacterales bacterium]|nr:extracellular solute-binding protein [Acidiferrobacterales bacterium]